MKSLIASLCAFAVANAFATVDITDGVLTFNVESGEETYSEAIGSDVVKVVKTGRGTGVLTVANADFKGETEIQAGFLKVTAAKIIGNDGKISVAPGAQLNVAIADAITATTLYFPGAIEVSGEGPDGTGAIRVSGSSGNGDKMFQSIRLLGGTAVGGTQRWGSQNWDLNSCTLTNRTSNQFIFYGATVVNPGSIVQEGNNSITVISSTSTFNGDEANVMKFVNSASSLSFWQCGTTKVPWTLDLREYEGSPFQYKSFGNDLSRYGDIVWTGPVQLGDRTLKFVIGSGNGPAYPRIAGSIIGAGGTVMQAANLQTILSGPVHDFAVLDPQSGSCTVTGGVSHTYDRILPDTVNNGGKNTDYKVLRFVDAADVAVTNGTTANILNVYSKRSDRLPARLEIAGKTEFTSFDKEMKCYAAYRTNTWGVVKVTGGASVTNVNLLTGYNNGFGALYVKDSSFHSNAGLGNDGHIGGMYSQLGNTYGYWGLSNSTVLVDGYTTMAYGQGTTAFLVQHGGLHKYNGAMLRLGHGGYAHYRVDHGGTFNHAAANFQLGSYYSGWSSQLTGGTAVMTVADGAFAEVSTMTVHTRENGVAQLNLNGGGRFRQTATSGYPSGGLFAETPSGSVFNLSFDGGIYVQSWSGDAFRNASGTYVGIPTRTVVHDGGALIDVEAGKAANWNSPLLAPTGKVVKAIAMPTDPEFLASTNIGPVRVEIADDMGVSASAFIAFDDDKEKLDRVVIDSPGTGYSASTTATAILQETGKGYPCAVTLADAVGGGVVKLGAGELYMKTVNTYAGATIISNGMMRLDVQGAIPSGRPLAVEAGATLFLQSFTAEVSSFSGSGKVTGSGTLSIGSLMPRTADAVTNGCALITAHLSLERVDFADVDFAALGERKDFRVCEFGEGVKLSAVPEFLNLPDNWGARLAKDGRSITARQKFGLAIIVR